MNRIQKKTIVAGAVALFLSFSLGACSSQTSTASKPSPTPTQSKAEACKLVKKFDDDMLSALNSVPGDKSTPAEKIVLLDKISKEVHDLTDKVSNAEVKAKVDKFGQAWDKAADKIHELSDDGKKDVRTVPDAENQLKSSGDAMTTAGNDLQDFCK